MEIGRREGGRLKTLKWSGSCRSDAEIYCSSDSVFDHFTRLEPPRLPSMQNVSNCALWELSF